MGNSISNMNQVFEKLKDLKVIFKLGEKVIPIIQNLIQFMGEIVPLLETINQSIADSTKKIPQATNQINDVTNATELATTEILDLVDETSNQLMDVEKIINQIKERDQQAKQRFEEIVERLNGDEELTKLINEYKELKENKTGMESIQNIMQKINDNSYKITLSLQVQDITTQQLSAVNHLIESVNEKLTKMVDEIDESDIKEDFANISASMPSGASFDANAKYDPGHDRQDKVDEIVLQNQEKATQEDIDKLFS
ncbi:MAG: protein phosphatase CheZ [Ignavibacteria bacterium]|jgi:chemotaxis regulatin CheY-phosphate phosphatase CheZ